MFIKQCVADARHGSSDRVYLKMLRGAAVRVFCPTTKMGNLAHNLRNQGGGWF